MRKNGGNAGEEDLEYDNHISVFISFLLSNILFYPRELRVILLIYDSIM